ncbi:hypothetical protein M0638_06700 [Roseomonas sp. NAR14]|uniref:Uncharacterized protein n=1 Tax=Roseomonas acroporae TaxID=2937791 RepID=A0A9X1Y8J3_9PROT|nr:hypothetical protein [Roseomonas acroporae]MCK8784067.1 hypothetical protein [Roseomonas acroporae]
MKEPEDRRAAAPPASLLRADASAPATVAVVAEVRSDASIKFDPMLAPGYLGLPKDGFGALLLWRFQLSWSRAQEVQKWLAGPSPVNPPITREEEFRDLINGLDSSKDGSGEFFLHYVGTFLAADQSYASYTIAVGMTKPVARQDYQRIWMEKLDALKKNPASRAWYDELIAFLRLCLDTPLVSEEFALLASNVGDLTGNAANHPMVTRLLAP